MAASDMRVLLAGIGLLALATGSALAQSASEVERCFQNPASCSTAAPPVAPPPQPNVPATRPAPDYASVLQSPEAERRRIQESLRTLDKYNGPIDGNLQSDATVRGIGEWQRGKGHPATGKLTPEEAQTLHADAAKAPIRRIEPPAIASPPATTKPPTNEELLKTMQARLAERRRAAEPKAKAASDALVADLKQFVGSDGKSGPIFDQFKSFVSWFEQARATGLTVGEILPSVEDYGDAKSGNAVTVEVRFATKKGEAAASHCMVFAWLENKPPSQRRDSKAFACGDVAGVEKWKSEQTLRSAWR